MAVQKRKSNTKARSIRFPPDYGDFGRIEATAKSGQFLPCLILNESYDGCCLVLVMPSPALQVNKVYRVQVGKLQPMDAEVIWIKKVDKESQLVKAGFRFTT